MAIGDVLGLMGLGKNSSQDGAISTNTTSISELTNQLQAVQAAKLGELSFLSQSLYKMLDTFLSGIIYRYKYYVDQVDGNDSYDGLTPATAWKTVAKVNSVSFVAGTVVLFKRGCTWREMLDVPTSGSAGLPIVFSAYGEGTKPYFCGADIVTGFSLVSGSYDAAYTTDPSIVIINGTRGTKKASKAACTSVGDWYWTGNVLSVFYGSDPSGLVEAGQRAKCIDVSTLRSNIVFDNLKFGGDQSYSLTPRGTNIIVNACEGTHVGNSNGRASVLLTSANIIVSNCYFHDGGGIGVMTTNATNCAIIGNVFRNYFSGAYPSGTGRGIYVGASENIIVLYNWIEDCYLGTNDLSGKSTLWAYNVVKGSKVDGMNFDDGIPGYPRKCWNNTVYHSPVQNAGHGIDIQVDTISANTGFLSIKNNLVYCLFTGSSGSLHGIWIKNAAYLDIDVDNNLVFKTAASTNLYLYGLGAGLYNTLAEWQAALNGAATITGKDAHGVSADPLFVSASTTLPDYHLQSTSPAIGAGADVGLHVDIDKVFISGVPAIGAYEYV